MPQQSSQFGLKNLAVVASSKIVEIIFMFRHDFENKFLQALPLSSGPLFFLQKKVTSQEISKQNLQDLSEILSVTLSQILNNI